MKALYELIQSLNRKEIAIVRNSLQNFYARAHIAESNMIDLFELLLRRKKMPGADFVSKKFFQKAKDNTLDKLSSRLKNKVLDILISEANNEKHAFDQVDYMTIKIRKKFTQFYQLYFSKGNGNSTCHNLLDEIIHLSLKYESYSALVEALRISKYFKGFNKGIEEFNHMQEKIIFYEYCNHCVYKSIDYYYKLVVIGGKFYGDESEEKKQIYLKKAITELDADFKKTKSAIVGYYLNQLRFVYHLNKNNYSIAHKICTELLVLLNNNKSVYRESRIAFVYDDLAQCDIFLGNFDEAVENTQKAQKLISKNSINFIVSKEIEFHALFYKGRNKEAQIILEDIIPRFKDAPDSLRPSKFQFFLANIFFKNGNYKRALNLLNTNTGISKNKPGWDIALRILKIMCMVELEHFDSISQQVDNLRKFIGKFKIKEAGKRNILILKILKMLNREGYIFNAVDVSEEIEILGGENKNYRWNYMTPELIPFHQWYLNKSNN